MFYASKYILYAETLYDMLDCQASSQLGTCYFMVDQFALQS